METLIEHGAAPYRNIKDGSDSYYVTLRDTRGNERTVWGVDLERAIEGAGVVSGDTINLKLLGKQSVIVPVPVVVDGVRTGEIVDKPVNRNVFEIERAESPSPIVANAISGAGLLGKLKPVAAAADDEDGEQRPQRPAPYQRREFGPLPRVPLHALLDDNYRTPHQSWRVEIREGGQGVDYYSKGDGKLIVSAGPAEIVSHVDDLEVVRLQLEVALSRFGEGSTLNVDGSDEFMQNAIEIASSDQRFNTLLFADPKLQAAVDNARRRIETEQGNTISAGAGGKLALA